MPAFFIPPAGSSSNRTEENQTLHKRSGPFNKEKILHHSIPPHAVDGILYFCQHLPADWQTLRIAQDNLASLDLADMIQIDKGAAVNIDKTFVTKLPMNFFQSSVVFDDTQIERGDFGSTEYMVDINNLLVGDSHHIAITAYSQESAFQLGKLRLYSSQRFR